MPHITTDDGVKLYYEEAGAGLPIIFVHEFAGDARSYEAQLRYFSRRYRCVALFADPFGIQALSTGATRKRRSERVLEFQREKSDGCAGALHFRDGRSPRR